MDHEGSGSEAQSGEIESLVEEKAHQLGTMLRNLPEPTRGLMIRLAMESIREAVTTPVKPESFPERGTWSSGAFGLLLLVFSGLFLVVLPTLGWVFFVLGGAILLLSFLAAWVMPTRG